MILIEPLILFVGLGGIGALLRRHRLQKDPLLLRAAILLATLEVLTLSFMLNRLDSAEAPRELFLAAAILNGAGALGYFLTAPAFFHRLVALPLSRRWLYGYAVVDLAVLFVALGLAWERYRGVAISLLHLLFFVVTVYGALLLLARYRRIEAGNRRTVSLLFLAATPLLIPLYLEAEPFLPAPFIHGDSYDALGIPLFHVALALGMPLAVRER